MNCPDCGKDLGEGSITDFTTISWCCTVCGIKINKEIKK